MYHKSVEKIKDATNFLIWFRHCLPQCAQIQMRPYLDQPYQLALKVLDCSIGLENSTVEEIAQKAEVSKDTMRQVINALRDAGVIFTINTVKGWKVLEVGMESQQAVDQVLQDVTRFCCIIEERQMADGRWQRVEGKRV